MRDWQKSLATETSTDAAQPETQAPNWSSQVTWSVATAVLTFVVLITVRPPFVESSDREKPLEPRRLNLPLVFVSSLTAGAVVLLLSAA